MSDRRTAAKGASLRGITTRNDTARDLGLAAVGLAALPAIKSARPYVLVAQLHVWHGVFETPTGWGVIGHAVWVSTLYAVPPLIAAWLVFRHRDVAS